MSDAPVVGSAAFELRATREQMKRDLDQAKRDLGGFTSDAERQVGASGERIGNKFGGVARSLAFGITAITAVFAAGIAMAVQFGKVSLEMADNLADAAQKIGISTDSLQEWQHVARRTGADANQVAGDLETFATKWQQAAAGVSKEAFKPFENLRFSRQDLREFKSADEALEAVMDRIYALRNPSDRSAMAEKLGLSSLSVAAREGADEVDRLRDEAQQLGLVMDAELIRKGAEAQEKLDGLSRVIGIQMAEAFIGLSDEVLAFTGHIADALRGLNNFLGQFDAWRQKLKMVYGDEFVSAVGRGDHIGAFRAVVDSVRSGRVQGMQQAYANPQSDSDDPALVRQRMAVDAFNARQNRERPGFDPDLKLPPGRVDNSAQRAAEREERRAERVQQEILRARERLLGVVDEEVLSAQQRYDLDRDRLKLERETRDAEIESKIQRDEIKSTEAEQLKAAHASADALEDRVLLEQSLRDIQNEQIAAQQVLLDFANDRLSAEADGAITESERRKVEREILSLRQKERRAALERAAADETSSPAEREAARRNLGMLGGMEAAEDRSFDQDSTGGRLALEAIEGTRERAKWVEDAAEAYAEIDKLRQEDRISEEEAAEAKAKINADLNEKRLASTSEFFGNLATLANSSNHTLAAIGKAAGIAQATIDGVVAVQKAWASAPFPFNLPAVAATTVATAANVAAIAGVGFAEGGYTGAGGKYEPAGIVHRGEYVFDAQATQRIGVQRLEALRFGGLPGFANGGLVAPNLPGLSIPAIAGSSRSSGRQLNVDLRGAVMTADLLKQMKSMADESGGRALADARRTAPIDIARRERYRYGRNEE